MKKVLSLAKNDDYKDIFLKKGIEVIFSDAIEDDDIVEAAKGAEEIVMRPFRIAKSQGCKFYLGSDAHSTAALDAAVGRFDWAVSYLDLKETDKFHISK